MNTNTLQPTPRYIRPTMYHKAPYGYTILDHENTAWVKGRNKQWHGININTGTRHKCNTEAMHDNHHGNVIELHNPLSYCNYPALLTASTMPVGTICKSSASIVFVKTYPNHWQAINPGNETPKIVTHGYLTTTQNQILATPNRPPRTPQ